MVYFIASVSGLSDGVNPCALATLSVFIFLNYYLLNRHVRFLTFGLAFVFISFAVIFVMNLWPFQFVFAGRSFALFARGIYLMWAAALFCLGLKNLYQWWLIKRSCGPVSLPTERPPEADLPLAESAVERSFSSKITSSQKTLLAMTRDDILKKTLFWFLTVVMGMFFTLLSTVWPANYYMMLWGTILFTPGRILPLIFFYLIYSVAYVIPLIFVMLAFAWSLRSASCFKYVDGKISLFKIVTAAVLMAFGSSLFYIFY